MADITYEDAKKVISQYPTEDEYIVSNIVYSLDRYGDPDDNSIKLSNYYQECKRIVALPLPEPTVKSDVEEKEGAILGWKTEQDFELKEAKELIEKFLPLTYHGAHIEQAKAAAIICVDKIIEVMKRQNPNYKKNTYWHPIDYWQLVKQAIQSM